MWAAGVLPGNIFMMQSDFLNGLKCDILCVGPGWESTEWAETTAPYIPAQIELLWCFLQRNVLVRTYLVQSEHVWKTLPSHSLALIHSPPSPVLSLPLSVSSWHVGSLPDHQPVSSDSLLWQSSSTKEAEQLTILHPPQFVFNGCPKDKAFY